MQSYISLHIFTPQDTLGGGLVATFCLTFAIPQTVDHQASLSMGFPKQEYWSGLSFPSPGDLPNPWTDLSLPHCRRSPVFQVYCYWVTREAQMVWPKALKKKKNQFNSVKFLLTWFSQLTIDYQFSSVTQSCLTLCDPVDCSMPSFLVHHQLQSWWCHPTISSSVVPFSFCLPSFPASGSFQTSQFFASVGRIIGVSASASVLPMNIQDWFPLGWTGLIETLKSLLQHHSSKVSILQCSAFFMVQLSHPYMTTWKNHSFD